MTKFTKTMKRLVMMFTICFIVFTTKHMWIAKEYKQYDESFFTSIYDSTTDTGESSPIWSVRFMEKRFQKPLEVINGNAEIKTLVRSSTKHHYLVITDNEIRLVENTLYFPGWKVFIDGEKAPIQFQDPQYRGLMTFDIKPGKHEVRIEFSDSRIRLLSNAISLLGIFLMIITGFLVKYKYAPGKI